MMRQLMPTEVLAFGTTNSLQCDGDHKIVRSMVCCNDFQPVNISKEISRRLAVNLPGIPILAIATCCRVYPYYIRPDGNTVHIYPT